MLGVTDSPMAFVALAAWHGISRGCSSNACSAQQTPSKPNMTATGSPKPRSAVTGTGYTPENDVRPELKTMAPYVPIVPYDILAQRLGRAPEDIVKLDANENPYGPAPAARAALANAEYIHIYPDPESDALRDALQDYTGLPKEHILAGAGADELIDLIFRLIVVPGRGDRIINLPPTFGMYKFDADINGASVVNVPRKPGNFAVDVDAVEKFFHNCTELSRPKILFVASPNNPDGSTLTDEQLLRLLALPTLVVLDEAYFEFADHDRISWVLRHNNLIVLRTFSKWAGLAGLRLGYGAFPLPLIKHLWKIKQPYNVTVASQLAGIASIRQKEDLLGKVSRLVAQRHRFYQEVSKLPWLHPFPSQSNYVLCRVGNNRSAVDIKNELARRGILVRYYTTRGLADCIRVSMGTDDQMEVLYKALAEI